VGDCTREGNHGGGKKMKTNAWKKLHTKEKEHGHKNERRVEAMQKKYKGGKLPDYR